MSSTLAKIAEIEAEVMGTAGASLPARASLRRKCRSCTPFSSVESKYGRFPLRPARPLPGSLPLPDQLFLVSLSLYSLLASRAVVP